MSGTLLTRGLCALVVVGSLCARGLACQEQATDYVRLPELREIALARSAAPDEVSTEATVWVLRDGRYAIAVRGTNGNACIVARSMPRSLEPVCYDPEGAATVMRWEFEHLAQRLAGKTPAEAQAAVSDAIAAGRLPMPRRPAMAYMMSSEQRLFDPESGHDAGNWRPHIMYYVPNLTSEAIGLFGPSEVLFVVDPGAPTAHLIVVVREFVTPRR